MWMRGTNVKDIAKLKGCSCKTVRRLIDEWLAIEPEPFKELGSVKYLVVDGTYMKSRSESAVIVMDAKRSKPVFGKYGAKENFSCLNKLFNEMKDLGCNPISASIDGLPAVSLALREVWPEIIIQRCIVHIQRQGLMWCRIKPNRTDAKKLRDIFLKITFLKTSEDVRKFIEEVYEWEKIYGRKIADSRSKGWVFSDLKRARSMLLKALDNSFFFIQNSNIPKTTNMAEGCFSRLKGLLRDHRGVNGKRREQLFNWFVLTRK